MLAMTPALALADGISRLGEHYLHKTRWTVIVCSILVITGCSGTTWTSPFVARAAITGSIQDATTHSLIPFQTVRIKGYPDALATTDEHGKFTITAAPVAKATLVVSDAAGCVDGSLNVDIGAAGGSPRNLGALSVDLTRKPLCSQSRQ
jgi:hypothetical protein